MRVSIGLSATNWTACAVAARQAEEDGAAAVTASELKHDPFAPLAVAALATERVALVTSVAVAFPRSPMIIANQAWHLNRHSKGRFVVGLGSQIKAHNERRFSTPWIAPAARMGEYIESLRAILRCWETGEKPNYQGKYYSFSLMTPEFSPGPQGLSLPPLAMAAVGPLMLKTVARVADSVRLYSFATRDYLEKVVRPLLAQELEAAGSRSRPSRSPVPGSLRPARMERRYVRRWRRCDIGSRSTGRRRPIEGCSICMGSVTWGLN